jgi:hypothetical protein
MENRQGANSNNVSGYRGVGKTKEGKWRARVTHHRVTHEMGPFSTPELAHEAAKAKRLELFTHNDRDKGEIASRL